MACGKMSVERQFGNFAGTQYGIPQWHSIQPTRCRLYCGAPVADTAHR
jgi:hypothetical protein